jgi:NO-binding membrane sensor protein with MHYT domain
MGAGIGAMHYIGMAGMRFDAVLMYYPAPFALSVVNAIVCSTAALWIMSRRDDARSKTVAAAVMGLAIAGMHYTGMWAAVCIAAIGSSGTNVGLDPVLLAVAITMITLFMMAWRSSCPSRTSG